MSEQSLTDRLEAFFRAHPLQWIDGKQLGEIAGGYGWRTRCSDLRKRGMEIRNRQRRFIGDDAEAWVVSEYCYVPQEGDAPAPVQRGHDMNEWGLR